MDPLGIPLNAAESQLNHAQAAGCRHRLLGSDRHHELTHVEPSTSDGHGQPSFTHHHHICHHVEQI
jgi:hypothetical protein